LFNGLFEIKSYNDAKFGIIFDFQTGNAKRYGKIIAY